VKNQLAEMHGGQVHISDGDCRAQFLTHLTATEPTFDFSVDNRKLVITYSNLAAVTVSFFSDVSNR
jgi:hypothetical protein